MQCHNPVSLYSCGSVLSLFYISFSFALNSLSYITIPPFPSTSPQKENNQDITIIPEIPSR